MLVVTVQVTSTPHHLEQIGQLSIANISNHNDEVCKYNVYLDGVYQKTVQHHREDGWPVLLRKALE